MSEEEEDTITRDKSNLLDRQVSDLPPPPLPPPHSTTPLVPGMSSAPPSGNVAVTASAVSTATPSPAVGLPPPPIRGNMSSAATTNKSATIASLPPPPPPLPTSIATTTTTTTSTATTEPPLSIHTAQEPKPIDITSFQQGHSFLARRQTHLNILVIATESAHRLAWKNNLLLTELLEGLAHEGSSSADSSSSAGQHQHHHHQQHQQQQQIPFRTVNRSILLQWRNVKVTFSSPGTIQLNPQDRDGTESHQLLQHHAALQPQDGNLMEELDMLEDQVDVLLQQPAEEPDTVFWMDANQKQQAQHAQVVKDAYALTSPPNIPWLWRFRVALDHTTNHLSHDLIGQPTICLLVCSTTDNPDESFTDLSNPYNLPPQYQNGLWESESLRREALVLHDVQEGPQDVDLDILQVTLQQKHGPNASVLKVNSIHPGTAAALMKEEFTDIWNGGGEKGVFLSVADRLVVRRYISNIITASVLPSLERRIDKLNIIVTERKKGVRNVLRGLWRGGVKDETSSSGPAGFYRHDSIESQVRLLADSLFLIQDYDAALSTYKLIREDYKNDRALMHYASVQEMMALSAYLSDPHGRSREIFQYMETALFTYTRASEEERKDSKTATSSGRPTTASKATRLATRLCLVLSSAKDIMTPERHLEVADLLASASSNETSLGAAVLLEQSSSHYFQAGMYRKYAFHMLMSGHMFRSAQQEHHAFRCFTSALYIYHDGKWDELHNHLRSALAAQLYSLGRMAVSIELYAKLVGTQSGGKVSVKSQQKFVNHLLEICRDHSKKALVGSDRMAAPPGQARQESFQKMDAVLRQKGAKRVLELPNMDLPSILDDTVTCTVQVPTVESSLGTLSSGGQNDSDDNDDDDAAATIWESLEVETIAEWKASKGNKGSNSSNDEDIGKKALWEIEDPAIRRVVSEMDKERTNRSLMARARKSGNIKPQPAIRARQEPLLVTMELTNPLQIPIELHHLQLVARLQDTTKLICTTRSAINLPVQTEGSEDKTWTFAGCSDKVFHVPDFCRVSTQQNRWVHCGDSPFFVVTKETIRMEAGQQKYKMSLSLCPLVQGSLEILGVRCKLFSNGVWIYHPFKQQGPLLQNTQENRANRARAESMLLKSRIQEDMPRLTAQLIPMDNRNGAPVQGQVRKWTLKLTNIGTAPANNIVLKTNLPWIKMLQQPQSSAYEEGEAIACCVGPTATLLDIPVEVLAPGEIVELPVAIRTVGTTQQDFYMLYRYELVGASKKAHIRWLRQMVDVAIYPSLSVTASLMPSYWEKKEHILSLEMTNYRNDKIKLRALTLVSKEYELVPMPGQLAENDEGMDLDFQERVTLHYRLAPMNRSSSVVACSISAFGESGCSSKTATSARGDVVDFLCLESAQARFKAAVDKFEVEAAKGDDEESQPRHVSQIRRAKTAVVSEDGDAASSNNVHPVSIARLCPDDRKETHVELVCTWSNENNTVSGQTHVVGLPVRPKENSRGCPITITCNFTPNVRHDFSRGPAIVSFGITARNRLVGAGVDFEFAVERPKNFDFMGADCFNWTLEEGGDELTIPMQAVIPSPGVYNLQQIRLSVVKDDKKTPYLFPLQWMLTVTET